MARISFGSPWGTAIGGLGQGLTQGLLTGVELQERKRKAEQQQRHDAMALLMAGIKNMPEDPEQGQQYLDWMSKVLNKQLPPFPQIKPMTDRLKGAVEQFRQAFPNASEEQINNMAYQKITGYTPPKMGAANKPTGVKWFKTNEGYKAYGYGEQPPPGAVPMVTEPPWVTPYRETEGGRLEPAGPPIRKGSPIFHPKEEKGARSEFITNTQTGETKLKKIKPGDVLGPNESFATKKDIESDLEKKAQERLKKDLDYNFGTPEEKSAILAKTKEAIRKELQPWTQTGGKGKSFSNLPPAAQYKGKRATDTETGQRYQSDGEKWVPIQ